MTGVDAVRHRLKVTGRGSCFHPVDSDSMEWLRIAKEGGAKYLVFTTKHHDGFCKCPSALTNSDVMDQTEFQRDIAGKRPSLPGRHSPGCHYSLANWHRPETEYIRSP